MTSKDTYREICTSIPDLPLFMEPFWLDIVWPDERWGAVFSRNEEGVIHGAWAYAFGTTYGMSWNRLPVITPYTALWIQSPVALPVQKQIAHRHEVMLDLERQLPRSQILELKLRWTFQDWLPLYWTGYRQETRYTFRFPVVDTESIYAGFSKSFKRNLRAADREYTIEEGRVDDLYALMERVFELRDAHVTLTKQTLEHLVSTLRQRQQCQIYAARDTEGVQAIMLAVWDSTTTYYLIGGRRRTDSRHGMNLLLWQAIQDAGKRGHAFDFEGSMIEGVNKFFQSFGAELTPYHYIYRYRGLARLKYL